MDRRRCLAAAGAWALSWRFGALRAAELPPVVLATPGPGSSVSTIPELAVRIGADRAEGLALRLKFTGGGGIAIREILSGNAQFGVFGLSAAMNGRLLDVKDLPDGRRSFHWVLGVPYDIIGSVVPPISTLPPRRSPHSPMRCSSSSERPAPMRPAIPSTSPAWVGQTRMPPP